MIKSFPEIKIFEQPIIETRKTLILASKSAFHISKKYIGFNNSIIKDNINNLDDFKGVEVIYGIGGGTIIDLAKRAGHYLDKEVIIVPTLLSTDAFLTDVAAIRKNSRVIYLETNFVERVLVNFDLLLTAPFDYNLASIGDILAIQSAIKDWTGCDNYDPSKQYLANVGSSLVSELYNNKEILTLRNKETLEFLLNLLILKVKTGILLKSPYLEEGTEHYFVYLLENYLKHNYLHGYLVLLGVLSSIHIQNWNTKERDDFFSLVTLLDLTHISNISYEVIYKVLADLPLYCSKFNHENTLLIRNNNLKINLADFKRDLGEIFNGEKPKIRN